MHRRTSRMSRAQLQRWRVEIPTTTTILQQQQPPTRIHNRGNIAIYIIPCYHRLIRIPPITSLLQHMSRKHPYHPIPQVLLPHHPNPSWIDGSTNTTCPIIQRRLLLLVILVWRIKLPPPLSRNHRRYCWNKPPSLLLLLILLHYHHHPPRPTTIVK